MAGNYPDFPAPRLAYDRDGTIITMTYKGTGTPSQLSNANVQAINDNNPSSYYNIGNANSPGYYFAFIFPQLRDIEAIYNRFDFSSYTSRGPLQTSTDTTNGYDGTWTNVENPFSNSSAVNKANMRNDIRVQSMPGIIGLRFDLIHSASGFGGNRARAVHLYGRIANGETPDRLRIWHPTLDEPLDDNTTADGSWGEWGDSTRGTTADKTFRIKNNSTTLTANSVTVTSETLNDASPTLTGQITYSTGGSFASSVNLGNLAPGAISPVITVRRTTSSSAALGLWWIRAVAQAGSWT